jgi:hypothetical protein
MSDTPLTDARVVFFGFNPEEGDEFVQADFARDLERQNTALRADLLIEEERSVYWRDLEGKALAENAALRHALQTALAIESLDDANLEELIARCRCVMREQTSLDAARKEQP